MVNLLSQEKKTNASREFITRVVSVWAIGSCAVIIMSGLLLLPLWFAQNSERLALEPRAREVGAISDLVMQSKSRAETTHERASALTARVSVSPTFSLIDTIATSVAEYSNSITLTQVTVDRDLVDQNKKKVTVSGTAENREELIAFMRALQQSAQLEGVTIPVENLAGSNGVFTFTIVGTHI